MSKYLINTVISTKVYYSFKAFSWKSVFLQNKAFWGKLLCGYTKEERLKYVHVGITRSSYASHLNLYNTKYSLNPFELDTKNF